MQELIARAKELLADGTVVRVLGWKAGDLPYNPEAAYFETAESLDEFVYNGFCGQNLSKMMIEASKLEGKTLVCLKPCDTYSFNQLIKEHRVDREKAYIIGVGCKGKLNVEKLRQMGYSMAVVTATAQEQAVSNLKLAGLLPFFDHVISASMVKRGKPAPDVYLYACEVLGVQPENCYAVEDSPNGVMSAHAAGCRTIMIPDLSQPDAELSRLLYRKLDTFGELINILKK